MNTTHSVTSSKTAHFGPNRALFSTSRKKSAKYEARALLDIVEQTMSDSGEAFSWNAHFRVLALLSTTSLSTKSNRSLSILTFSDSYTRATSERIALEPLTNHPPFEAQLWLIGLKSYRYHLQQGVRFEYSISYVVASDQTTKRRNEEEKRSSREKP